MSKRKLALLLIVASGYVMALGLNCIPNIGSLLRLGTTAAS
ncbi:MAG: hypothetical protein U1D55_05085 [Phycisphaerae bacterium]